MEVLGRKKIKTPKCQIPAEYSEKCKLFLYIIRNKTEQKKKPISKENQYYILKLKQYIVFIQSV